MLLSSNKMAFDTIPKLEAENQELRRKVADLESELRHKDA
jgi:cell division protein FtsB